MIQMETSEGACVEDVWIPSVCRVCSNCCGIRVHRKNGVVVKIEGLPESPHNRGRMCAKGMAAIMSLHDPARPKKALIRTNPKKGIGVDPGWREADWNEAMNLVVGKLRKVMVSRPSLAHSLYQLIDRNILSCCVFFLS